MEIVQIGAGESCTLALKGRLDSRWANHLVEAVATALRDGSRCICLDLAQVSFVSSAGLRALLQAHKQIAAAKGHLHLASPSSEARSILELSGLDTLLVPAPDLPPAPEHLDYFSPHARWTSVQPRLSHHLTGHLWGQPDPKFARTLTIALPAGAAALGLGHLGDGPAGEFLQAGDTIFFLPPDGAGSPDFIHAFAADHTFQLSSPYGASFSGLPSLIHRFTQKPDLGPVPLPEILDTIGNQLQADRFGITLLAETSSLVGATLTRPIQASEPDPFDFPRIRDTLSFTTEPAFTRHLALVVGWLERSTDSSAPNPFLRPLPSPYPWLSHVHAVVFPYRPLPADLSRLDEALADILEEDAPEAILHLMHDPREDGLGSSTFTRGVVWAGPIRSIQGRDKS